MNVSIGLSPSYAPAGARLRSLLPLLLLLAATSPFRATAATQAADLVFVDGAVYTVDAARSWASAVAVRDGRIVYVGADAGALALVGKATRVVDLDGKMLLPGFQDSHVHPVGGGLELLVCDLNGAESVEELQERVRRWAAANPAAPWVIGGGWALPLFPNGAPHKRVLDEVVSDRPVFLLSADGHTGWANSKALELGGITAATADPPSGRIERDPATGEPIGALRESAMQLLARLAPLRSADEHTAGLALAVERAHRYGITGVVEASAQRQHLEAYRALDRLGRLNLHVLVSLDVTETAGPEQIEALVALRDEAWGEEIRPTAAKLFVDGVIESQTAALLEPYVGFGDLRGELIWSEPKLREIAVALDRAGFQIHLHAIGDRAIRASLDAIEAVAVANGGRDRRPTLAHIQLFDPADVPRFRKLGAAASFQPLWAYDDSYIRDLTLPVLGPERSRWLYPIASVAKSGAVLAGGSDWSVSSMNPLDAIEVAITRRAETAEAGPGWIPEERVDLATMLAAYTIGSAWAAFRERETGSIETGKLADLIVVDRNLFDIPPQEISAARVLLTLFRGQEVWRDPGFPPPAPPAR